MKRIFCLALGMLLVSAVGAQTPYFCTKVGTITLRSNYDSSNQLVLYTQQEVMSANEQNGVTTVVVHVETLNPDKTPFPYILPYDMTYEIRKGAVYPVLAAGNKETRNLGDISIPADMKVGDDYGEGKFEISHTNETNKSKIYYRKVTAQERITTPAGTFDCMILEQLSENKILGIKQKSIGKTWYARGVGEVKSEIYTRGGKLRSKVILESISERK